MTALAIVSTTILVWISFGLFVAHRLEPKVARLAFLVLGSSVLWPLTWWMARAKRTRAGNAAVSG